MTLLELAERCEQAMEVEQCDLLYAAYRIVGPESHDWRWDHFLGLLNAKAYLDAAMTLVPEGLHLAHSGEGRFLERGRFVASVEGWATERDDEGQEIFTTPLRRHGVAQTFALALCAAALRARTSMEDQPHDQ